MKPMKVSYAILLKKKKFYLFLGILTMLIGYGKNIFFVFRNFNPLHPNISMYILLTVI